MKRIIISLALLLFIPGCLKVGPDFSPPQVATQSHWRNSSAGEITTRDEQLNHWWKLLNDPHLDSLITMAARQNLSLKAAAMRVLEARALLGIAVGEFFPQTQEAVGEAMRQKTSKNTPNRRTSDRKYWDFQLGLTAAWELDFWGKFRRAIESVGQELCAEQADFDDVLVILLSDVASTYVSIRTLEERIDIVKQNVTIQERSLEIVLARWEAGMVTELDVKQAETLVSSTEARLPELTADLQSGENALAVLLGIPPLDIDCFLHTAGKIPVPPLDIAASIPCALLHRRPDIRRAYHET
ncbi:MAG: Toluene efflux pump outer membrane protein TtgF, partial [Chlamydiae bacterium]|nr:Toluene efflux pump outer membrane protein TtgF [Chlamydiota bacterium]